MRDDLRNDEEYANTDKLDFFYYEKVKCHIILKRKLKNGNNVFLNGFVLDKLSNRLYLFKDEVLGEIRIAISEIAGDGVKKFTEVGE